MQSTLLPGVMTWSRWQPDRELYFNSWLVDGDEGALVVDPLPLDEGDIAALDGRLLHAVVLTNRDHERAAAEVAARYEIPIFAPDADADEIVAPVARRFRHGDTIGGWRVVTFEGFKTAGESALVRNGVAITGDAFWGVPAGALRLMPDEKLADPERAALSARRLLEHDIRHLLVGDGMPIYGHAFDALVAMLDQRTGTFVRRVNLDAIVIDDEPGPRPYGAIAADVGRLIGAKRLGYALGRLAPGDVYCPYHWHTREEEVLLVWRGRATLRTPSGTFAIREGDVVAFPVGPLGAHRLENDSDAPCLVLITANIDPGDVCFYPDSRKLLVEAADLIVRSEPELGYFDGELPTT